MINGFYSIFKFHWLLKALYNNCHSHTFIRWWQGADLLIRSGLGFSILLKDSLAYSRGSRGIKQRPPNYWMTRSIHWATAASVWHVESDNVLDFSIRDGQIYNKRPYSSYWVIEMVTVTSAERSADMDLQKFQTVWKDELVESTDFWFCHTVGWLFLSVQWNNLLHFFLVKCSNWKKNYDEKYSPYRGRSEHSEAWPVHFLTTISDWITEAPVFIN